MTMKKERGATKQQHPVNFSFTDNRIEKLKLPENKEKINTVEYSDKICIGLKLMHSCLSGRKIFHQRYHSERKKKSIKIGEFPAVNVELARKIADANKALLAQGLDPAQERTKQFERLTFQQFAEQIYLPDAITRKKSSSEDKRKLERDMYKVFGNKLLVDISKGDISRYLNGICNRASGPTANRHRALLSTMMNMAINHDLIEKNNVTHFKKFAETTEHGRSLTQEELGKLLAALATAKNQVSALAIKMLLASGLRKTETLSILRSNINFTECLVRLEAETTKGNRTRYVALNPFAMDILRELEKYKRAGNPYLFPGEGMNRLTEVRKTFESSKRKAAIENFWLHCCRHNFITTLADKGVSPSTIQKLVGHRSLTMTERYIHHSSDTLQATSKIMSDHLNLAVAA